MKEIIWTWMCVCLYRMVVWCAYMYPVQVLPACVQWPLQGSAAPSAQGFVCIREKSISPAHPSLHPLTPAPHAPVWSVWQFLLNCNKSSDIVTYPTLNDLIVWLIPPLFLFSPPSHFTSDQNEVVNCQKRPCPVQCSHPVPSDTCCPVCDSCLYEGIVRSHSHTFTASTNPCQRCTCVRGTVTCVPLVCPPTPCVRPVTKPGQCCPECTGTSWISFMNDKSRWSVSANLYYIFTWKLANLCSQYLETSLFSPLLTLFLVFLWSQCVC